MAKPLALCLEELKTSGPTYTGCVALVGDEPGLALDAYGAPLWQRGDRTSCSLWVTDQGRLVIHRQPSAPPAMLERWGRTVEISSDEPLVLVDRDKIVVGGRHLRVHIHGATDDVHPPEALSGGAARQNAEAIVQAQRSREIATTQELKPDEADLRSDDDEDLDLGFSEPPTSTR
jgi:hypothetical protein